MDFVVATWNIHGGLPADVGTRTVGDSLELLDKLRPDVVAFQEVEFDGLDGPVTEPSARFVTAAGLAHSTSFPQSPSHHTPGRMLGVTIASRWQVDPIGRVPLPNPRFEAWDGDHKLIRSHDKGLLMASVDLGPCPLVVGCVHVTPFHRFNRSAHEPGLAQIWTTIARAADEAPAGPLIVAGDFNTEDRALLIDRVRNQRLRSAAQGIPSRPTGESHDDLLYNDRLATGEVHHGETFSDHHIIVAEFKLVGGN